MSGTDVYISARSFAHDRTQNTTVDRVRSLAPLLSYVWKVARQRHSGEAGQAPPIGAWWVGWVRRMKGFYGLFWRGKRGSPIVKADFKLRSEMWLRSCAVGIAPDGRGYIREHHSTEIVLIDKAELLDVACKLHKLSETYAPLDSMSRPLTSRIAQLALMAQSASGSSRMTRVRVVAKVTCASVVLGNAMNFKGNAREGFLQSAFNFRDCKMRNVNANPSPVEFLIGMDGGVATAKWI